MTQEQIERAIVLLEATKTILTKCEDSTYVLNVSMETAEYDGTECDGYCLNNDIKEFLEEINI